MWRVQVLFCFLLVLFDSLFAQVAPATAKPMLRMERAQPGEVSCVLVQDDGSYRLEKMFRAETNIYSGAPGSIQLNALKVLLNNEGLATLSQADIHDSLIGDTLDIVQIAIWRGNARQELSFPSPDSRKQSKEFVEPLLHWFQVVQKEKPAAVRLSGNPTRCMPSRIQESIVSTSVQPATNSPSSRTGVDYLFRFSSSHFYEETPVLSPLISVESTCTVVFQDGRFHRERSHQEYMGKRHDKIAEGQLDPSTLKELSEILNSAELRAGPERDVPDSEKEPLSSREGTMTVLSIPRKEKVQRLKFRIAQNTLGNPLEIGGKSNLGYRIPDRKLLAPLLHWMKKNTDKQARKLETAGVGNDCYPLKASAGSDKSASQ